MKQRFPLLEFKEELQGSMEDPLMNATYNQDLGFWVAEDGQPLVSKLVSQSENKLFAQTTKTATREGADQPDSLAGPTTVTRTREGVDQSETVFGQTTATKTRETSDRSSTFIPSYGPTRITETREGTDRSENSSW